MTLLITVALVAGIVGGGALGLLAQGAPRLPQASVRSSAPTGGEPSASPSPLEPVVPDTLLAWTPGGLPNGLAGRVARLRDVDHVVAVVSGTAWLDRSVAADGTILDHPQGGLAIPIETAGADLSAYAPFLSPADRSVLPKLAQGQGVLGATSAVLRRLGQGGVLEFGHRRIRMAGVVPDTAVGAHELFVSRATAAALGIDRERYLLIDPSARASRKRLEAQIRKLLPAGLPVRIRGPGETPYFRQGDAVLPPVRLKQLFGEFAARPISGGPLDMDPSWVARHIVIAQVPVLGTVQCNRAILPQLRGALAAVAREGLASLIHRSDYGGCFNARFVNEDPLAGISHHTWGVAIDINVSANQFGRTPMQDPRLVAIFARWGFTWGGSWLVPDGMHFEFTRFAPAGGA
jgi:hypothetical protein